MRLPRPTPTRFPMPNFSNWFLGLIRGNAALRNNLNTQFPFLGLSALDKAKAIPETLLKSLADPNLQEILFAFIIQYYGFGTSPEEMYKPGTLQKIIDTIGYGGQSIAAGAYQKVLGKLPDKEILPTSSLESFESSLMRLKNKSDLDELDSIINYYEKEVSDFLEFFGIK